MLRSSTERKKKRKIRVARVCYSLLSARVGRCYDTLTCSLMPWLTHILVFIIPVRVRVRLNHPANQTPPERLRDISLQGFIVSHECDIMSIRHRYHHNTAPYRTILDRLPDRSPLPFGHKRKKSELRCGAIT